MSKISTGHARKLIQNFKRLKIGKTIKKRETRGVWFSRGDIEFVLNTPVSGITPTGLRFYFAAYEKKSTTHPAHPPKYKEEEEKITLVIVPTKGVNNSGHVINHAHRAGEIVHFDLLGSPDMPPRYDAASFSGRRLAATADNSATNDGQICPPPPLDELGLDNGL